MTIDEILSAIEALDVTDLVPVLEVVTAKLAGEFGYLDSYSVTEEMEMAPTEDLPVEDVTEEAIDEMTEEEEDRLVL